MGAGGLLGVNRRRVRVGLEIAGEARRVEADRRGVRREILVAKRLLVLEESVVHLPELPLGRSGFGRLGRVLRVRVRVGARRVTEHEAKAVAEAPLQLLHDGVGATAVVALEVTVFDQRDRRSRRTEGVIARADGALEQDDGGMGHGGLLGRYYHAPPRPPPRMCVPRGQPPAGALATRREAAANHPSATRPFRATTSTRGPPCCNAIEGTRATRAPRRTSTDRSEGYGEVCHARASSRAPQGEGRDPQEDRRRTGDEGCASPHVGRRRTGDEGIATGARGRGEGSPETRTPRSPRATDDSARA